MRLWLNDIPILTAQFKQCWSTVWSTLVVIEIPPKLDANYWILKTMHTIIVAKFFCASVEGDKPKDNHYGGLQTQLYVVS